ncbi:hypothetical protein J7M23_09250, partial [Candidatus Sumerlaeota bacterium]|nr:hypothetical protein [Candidatus Sumerlaeota bacterium]
KKMRKSSNYGGIVYAVIFSVILSSILISFGGCAKKEAKPRYEDEPIVLFPSGALVLASLNLEKYRTPEAEKQFEKMLSTNPLFKAQMDKIKETTGIDLFRDIDSISFAIYIPEGGTGEEGEALVLSKGRFNETKIIAAIKKEAPSPIKENSYKNTKYYSGTFKNNNAYLALPRPRFAVASSDEKLFQGCLDRFENPLPSVLEDPALKEVLSTVDRQSPFWVAGKLPAIARDKLVQNEDSAFLGKVKSYYLYFKQPAEKGMYMEIGTICDSSADAEEVKKGLQNFLTQIKGFLMFAPGGEAANILLDKALVETEGKTTKLVIKLTEQELKELQQKMQESQKQFQQMMPPPQSK